MDSVKIPILILRQNLEDSNDNFKHLELEFIQKPVKFDELKKLLIHVNLFSSLDDEASSIFKFEKGIIKSEVNKGVLIAEDVMTNRTLVKAIIDSYFPFVSVYEACDGEEALNIINKEGGKNIDLILMDIQMPNMDGFEATQRIRTMYPKEKIAIIALTAGVFKDDKEKAFSVGIDDFLSKPLDIKKMVQMISKHLKK